MFQFYGTDECIPLLDSWNFSTQYSNNFRDFLRCYFLRPTKWNYDPFALVFFRVILEHVYYLHWIYSQLLYFTMNVEFIIFSVDLPSKTASLKASSRACSQSLLIFSGLPLGKIQSSALRLVTKTNFRFLVKYWDTTRPYYPCLFLKKNSNF